MMNQSSAQVLTRITEQYYDSNDADRFYFEIWGGEDIHIGLYDQDQTAIREASRRTVERMAGLIASSRRPLRVLDLGAGYGGAARWLASNYGARVCCLNLSRTQNERNRALNHARGLDAQIEVVHGAFESIPKPNACFDVVWSQDALLHSAERAQVFAEAARVLVPGGQLVFTDPMQADDCPEGVLGPVLARIHLDSLGSPASYRRMAAAAGLQEVGFSDLSPHLVRHYQRVHEELRSRYSAITRAVSQSYVDRMLQGLRHWIDAGSQGYLCWGILQFCRPA